MISAVSESRETTVGRSISRDVIESSHNYKISKFPLEYRVLVRRARASTARPEKCAVLSYKLRPGKMIYCLAFGETLSTCLELGQLELAGAGSAVSLVPRL